MYCARSFPRAGNRSLHSCSCSTADIDMEVESYPDPIMSNSDVPNPKTFNSTDTVLITSSMVDEEQRLKAENVEEPADELKPVCTEVFR